MRFDNSLPIRLFHLGILKPNQRPDRYKGHINLPHPIRPNLLSERRIGIGAIDHNTGPAQSEHKGTVALAAKHLDLHISELPHLFVRHRNELVIVFLGGGVRVQIDNAVAGVGGGFGELPVSGGGVGEQDYVELLGGVVQAGWVSEAVDWGFLGRVEDLGLEEGVDEDVRRVELDQDAAVAKPSHPDVLGNVEKGCCYVDAQDQRLAGFDATEIAIILLINLLSLQNLFKVFAWLQKPFASQLEGPPVHPQRLPGFQMIVYEHSLFRIDMLETQELPGFVSPNGQQAAVDIPIPLVNLLKQLLTVSCIARIVYLLFLGSNEQEGAPEPLKMVENPSAGPMAAGQEVYLVLPALDLILVFRAPVHHGKVLGLSQQILGLEPHNNQRLIPVDQSLNGSLVEVVLMVVAYQDDMDCGELLEGSGDFYKAFVADGFGHGVREDRVCQDVDWAVLDQDCGVADPDHLGDADWGLAEVGFVRGQQFAY